MKGPFMTNALRLLLSSVFAFGVISIGCAAGETVGTGSSTGTGNFAGTSATITGLAGTTGTGNVTGAAGTNARGGTTGTGNVTGAAGTGAGNVTGAAGTSVTGAAGTTPITGIAGTTGSTTGSAGTSGSTTTCGANFEVAPDGFARAPAAGGKCWSGYAFAGGDAGSTITPTTFMACGTPCMLKMMGTVGAATMANNYVGVGYIGFNLGQPVGAAGAPPPVTPGGSSVTVTFTATTGGLPLRVQLGADTTGTVSWCYTIAATAVSAGTVTIPYAMFNRTCWDNAGAAYAKEPIVSLQMVVPGGATATTGVSVAITGVKENL
jgi:hypothetical protein